MTLYGREQSRLARHLERRELRHPDAVFEALRGRLVAGLSGRVIEVGAGDGKTFAHYPAAALVAAVEPDPAAREAAVERARAAAAAIEVAGGDAAALPGEDSSFDAAVLATVLCSVGDPGAALRELRRVLRPGGELRFFEHVRSEHAAFRGLQRAADRLFWTRMLGGCETSRDTVSAIRAAGFEIVKLERGFHASSPLTLPSAPYVLGVAIT